MCGICGELRFDGRAPSLPVLQRMLARLARRGPDAEGRYCNAPVLLGHRRLSVIDLSSASNQPLVDDEAGLALVFNGTIYNYKELRAELIERGHRFRSQGDTEVILQRLRGVGRSMVARLTACSRSPSGTSTNSSCFWRATASASSRCITRKRLPSSASPRTARRCWRPAGWTPASIRWRCIIISRCTPWCRRRAPLLRGLRKLPPAHVMTIDARRPRPRAALLGTGQHDAGAGAQRTGMGRGRARGAGSRRVSAGARSPTCRSACCSPAGWTPVCWSRCWPSRARRTC